jgi:phosphoribosylformimino-5-aminoimidazole carboxamide ribotide isomerase
MQSQCAEHSVLKLIESVSPLRFADSSTRVMRFRPCIDLHAGKVKQIVGSTLSATGASTADLEVRHEILQILLFLQATRVSTLLKHALSLLLLSSRLQTNFETTKSSADFAALYKRDALPGGHVIMLGPNCEEVSFIALYDTLLIADGHYSD